MRNYTYRKVTRADYPLLEHWLRKPHVRVWWDDADRELALMERDMENDAVDMRIVELLGRPFAYVQDADAHQEGAPQFSDLPQGTRSLDTFLGDTDYLGQGHAIGYLESRVRDLLKRFPMVAVDPNSTNTRAINTYTQAGFKPRRLASSEDGKLVQVMTHQ